MRRRAAVDGVLCCLVFVTTFFYRFNSLGGSLGGFSNDEFGYLARARQIEAGEVPFRDFNDPGWFLTDYVAAAAQWLAGYNLRSEALLTIGMLSAAAALTFWLSRRAAGSVVAALSAVAIHIALSPRHYNYPKLLLYAVGVAMAWAYADKPDRVRLAGLGATIGIAFLFRHDHLLYLGALGVTTVVMVHGTSIRNALPDAAFLCTVAAVFVVPFLVFLALAGGVGEYFRLALVYVERDAQRTSFSLPRFSQEPYTAFLYYAFFSLPLVAAGVLVRLRTLATSTQVMSSVAHVAPLLVLAAMVNFGFMSRGSTSIRIPDVGVTSAILLAWLVATFIGRDGRLLLPHRIGLVGLKAVAVVGLGLTVLSVNGLAQTSRALEETGFTSGPAAIGERAGEVWEGLGVHPSTFAEESEQPGVLKIVDYLRACTQRDDRLFVLGVYPELYYFADRRFAGGHAWLLPLYYSDGNDEARIVARLKQASVPIVLTEQRSEYEEEYRRVFEQVDAYLRAEYADVAEIDIGGSSLTVFVRSGLSPSGQYEPLGLPCFASSDKTGDETLR